MSKLSFRARALDASKPMPIYMAEELPDLPDYSAINRAVPQMPSGMQKEEESVSAQAQPATLQACFSSPPSYSARTDLPTSPVNIRQVAHCRLLVACSFPPALLCYCPFPILYYIYSHIRMAFFLLLLVFIISSFLRLPQEHHLQRAMCSGLIIPTPEVTSLTDVESYEKIYPADYKLPRQLIHMQRRCTTTCFLCDRYPLAQNSQCFY